MPNPTSKLNLVINGATTQLDIHDANAVDLTSNQTVAGDKEFTGTTTAHDVVPSATDTYNFGSSSAQWNNAYIKSLTINGVAAGDILTHNASEFVNVTSAQTIAGNKEFTDLQTIRYGTKYKGNKDAYILPEFSAGYSGLSITTLSFSQTLKIGNFVLDNNNKPVLDTSKAYIQVATGEVNNVNTCLIEPINNTSSSLGTSTNKWKTFNGLNPGALSLPGNYINVDTTNWVLDGSNVNIFTPTSDGWLGIQAIDTVYDQMHYVFVGRTGGGSTYYQQNLISPISALWDSKYHGCIFIPVIKNMTYHIRCICSSITATFYPCQGNV